MKSMIRNRHSAFGIRQCRQGFTLIELLVVTVILGLVTGVIASCLAGGIRVWDSVYSSKSVEAGTVVGLRLMEKDLMNSFQFYGISFSGDSRDVSFPGLIQSQIGTVKYFLDENKEALFRKEWIYPAEEPSVEDSEKILSKLEDMELHYYYLSNATDKVCEWRSSWNSTTNLPDGVRIELSVKDNGQLVRISRTVLLPVGEI